MREIYLKFKKYGLDLFRYDNIGRFRIGLNLLRLGWYSLIGRRYVEAPVNGYKMRLDLQTSGLSRTLFVYNSREILDTYLVQQVISGSMQVLDIGGNIGYYALLEAQQLGIGGRVYALEPDPRNLELLRQNIVLNSWLNRVNVFPYAASDHNHKDSFYLAERTNVSGFVKTKNTIGQVEVDYRRLDDEPWINKIDFIRMDLEGYECHVLRGLRQFLSQTTKPVKIMLEVHRKAYDDREFNFLAELNWLSQQGFIIRYLIAGWSTTEMMCQRGYEVKKEGVEARRRRVLYERVKLGDVLTLLNQGGIRAMMLEKAVEVDYK